MSTRIQWADETWNPMTGCTPVSEACVHCYAERMARRFMKRSMSCEATNVGCYEWDCDDFEHCSERYFLPRFHHDRLDVPLHWRKPRRIFVCSMSDLFHEAFTDEQRDKVFAVMAGCTQHTFMVLTKRPGRMRDYMTSPDRQWLVEYAGSKVLPAGNEAREAWGTEFSAYRLTWPQPHIWLGVTAETQQRADERIPIMLDTPAAVRFVSYEPALGPLRLGCMPDEMGFTWLFGPQMTGGIDWVICGGETGPGARPMQPEWALGVWRQCKAAGVPFFWKQGGSASAIPPHKPYTKMIATREFPEATHD